MKLLTAASRIETHYSSHILAWLKKPILPGELLTAMRSRFVHLFSSHSVNYENSIVIYYQMERVIQTLHIFADIKEIVPPIRYPVLTVDVLNMFR